MKRKIQIVVSSTAACLMAFTALAQETIGARNGGTRITEERPLRSMQAVRLGRTGKANDVIGMEVRNYDGETLGKLDAIAFHQQ